MTALCGCGRASGHPGMCSAKWVVRKAKAADPNAAQPISEEEIARRLFGDLATDVLLLRARGHTVARFRDGFRVDRDVLTADTLSTRAKALRDRPARAPTVRKKSCGGVESRHAEGVQGHSAEALGATDLKAGGCDLRNGDVATGNPATAGVAPGPQDLDTRMAHIEQRIDFLFAAVAEAVACRRVTLIEQAAGLEQLQATLRGVASA